MDLQNDTNEITVVSEESTSTTSNTGIIIGGIVVVILIAGGLYFYKSKCVFIKKADALNASAPFSLN